MRLTLMPTTLAVETLNHITSALFDRLRCPLCGDDHAYRRKHLVEHFIHAHPLGRAQAIARARLLLDAAYGQAPADPTPCPLCLLPGHRQATKCPAVADKLAPGIIRELTAQILAQEQRVADARARLEELRERRDRLVAMLATLTQDEDDP